MFAHGTQVEYGPRRAGRERRRPRQFGGSLIEHLLAQAIIATVLVGLLGLQHALLRREQWRWQREGALWLSRGLLERAEANRGADYRYHSGVSPAAPADCDRRRCSRAEMARHDLVRWQRAVLERLPGAELRVSGSPGAWRLRIDYPGLQGRNERLQLGP